MFNKRDACNIIMNPECGCSVSNMAVRSRSELRPYNSQVLSSPMAFCYRYRGENGKYVIGASKRDPPGFHVACMNSDSEERT